ncbi:hypothetical protein Tco_1383672 [Tanacetum coccineum]
MRLSLKDGKQRDILGLIRFQILRLVKIILPNREEVFLLKGFQDDEGVMKKQADDTELFVSKVTLTELIQYQEGVESRIRFSTSWLEERSAEKRSRKDKGKAILDMKKSLRRRPRRILNKKN